MAGRPKYNADMVLLDQLGQDPVLERLEAGKSLTTICRELAVSKRALNDWLDKPEHAGLASRARARAADQLAAEVLEIADSAAPEEVNLARLRTDVRKWVAAKWNPAAYGEQRGPSVVINVGDLHLRALKQTPITIESTPVDLSVTDQSDEASDASE